MEIEIKLTGATAERFRTIGDALGPYRLGPAEREEIVDVYFDTPAHDLMRKSVGLRHRTENGREYYTYKARESFEGGVSRRVEVEVEATPANWAALLARAGAPSPVGPLLTIRTLRLKRQVTLDGSPVAVAAFDAVDYGPYGTFWDIEFELAAGADEAHLRALAACLPDLAASPENKLKRGLRLAGVIA